MVLPVETFVGEELAPDMHGFVFQCWAVQARNGRRRTEGLLVEDKQHLVDRDEKSEVHGLIQAVNRRVRDKSQSRFEGALPPFEKEGRHAEVGVFAGQVAHVLDCFS